MELNPFKATGNVAWFTLKKTGVLTLARTAIQTFSPASHVKGLQESNMKGSLNRQALILQGVGELQLQVGKGFVEISPEVMDSVWTAVKTLTPDVGFDKVFDPHVADLLENSTKINAPAEK